jgi:hypothetical protein
MTTSERQHFNINVGPLTGLASLSRHAARPLRRFSQLFVEGLAPEVQWDLTNVEPRRMSMAGLTAFLALAHRVRQFTGKPSLARIRWDPGVFAFWKDISLLKIVQRHDLLEWVPHNILGGYESGKTNPNTQILCIPHQPHDLPFSGELNVWKDVQRQSFKENLELWCGHLFRPKRDVVAFERRLGDQVALTTAELVVNSLLWGRAPAFVGLQRTSHGITVSVCDCGFGLLKTLGDKGNWPEGCPVRTNLDAVVAASLMNVRQWGLRRAIDIVTENSGWVIVASFDSHVRWHSRSWQIAKSRLVMRHERLASIREVTPFLPDADHNVDPIGLRGVRITFEIPIASPVL